jgi:hypothetical protein
MAGRYDPLYNPVAQETPNWQQGAARNLKEGAAFAMQYQGMDDQRDQRQFNRQIQMAQLGQMANKRQQALGANALKERKVKLAEDKFKAKQKSDDRELQSLDAYHAEAYEISKDPNLSENQKMEQIRSLAPKYQQTGSKSTVAHTKLFDRGPGYEEKLALSNKYKKDLALFGSRLKGKDKMSSLEYQTPKNEKQATKLATKIQTAQNLLKDFEDTDMYEVDRLTGRQTLTGFGETVQRDLQESQKKMQLWEVNKNRQITADPIPLSIAEQEYVKSQFEALIQEQDPDAYDQMKLQNPAQLESIKEETFQAYLKDENRSAL